MALWRLPAVQVTSWKQILALLFIIALPVTLTLAAMRLIPWAWFYAAAAVAAFYSWWLRKE